MKPKSVHDNMNNDYKRCARVCVCLCVHFVQMLRSAPLKWKYIEGWKWVLSIKFQFCVFSFSRMKMLGNGALWCGVSHWIFAHNFARKEDEKPCVNNYKRWLRKHLVNMCIEHQQWARISLQFEKTKPFYFYFFSLYYLFCGDCWRSFELFFFLHNCPFHHCTLQFKEHTHYIHSLIDQHT